MSRELTGNTEYCIAMRERLQKREPPRGRTGSGQARAWAVSGGRDGKSTKSEPVRWAGGGNVPLSGARFAQDMRESIVAADRNRFYHGGQRLLPQ